MNIYHFCYDVQNTNTLETFKFDLKPFLKALTHWDTSIEIASNVILTGDKTFLIPVDGIKDFYLFISAKTNDAVQKIQKTANKLQTSNILNELGEDTSIGFASYVLFDTDRNIFSFASRLGAPTAAGFKNFMHNVFSLLEIGGYEFRIDPIQDSLSKDEATNLPVIGRTSILVNKDNDLFNLIADYLVGNSYDRDLIEGIQVTFKPEIKQNIRDSVKNALTKIKSSGLESIRVQGKRVSEDEKKLREFRVIEEGNITQEVKSFDSVIIHQEMLKATELPIVQDKYNFYLQKNEFSNDELKALTHFYDVENWK